MGLENKPSSGEDSIPMTIIKKSIPFLAEPLSYIFNTSFATSTFPKLFKTSIIIPIHKKGAKTDVNNFRPISLLNNFSKVLEKIVALRLSLFLEHLQLFNNQQFGFRSSRSTSDAVSCFLKELDSHLSNKNVAIGIFCDLTRAFDCVDHNILLAKLPFYGVRGTSVSWFKSYLEDRTQSVKIPSSTDTDALNRKPAALSSHSSCHYTSSIPLGGLVDCIILSYYKCHQRPFD
ncbi:hypothetical protein M8J77_003240 [Diaphorina citri]|nr:hypothetical protein M8J77_003240 [Diaphorina citri]